jgi:GT2 family glycosyltransferase
MSNGGALLTIAIPTYRRGQVLLDTLSQVIALRPIGVELIILDQSPSHEEAICRTLANWHRTDSIRWIRLPGPSITMAMNRALVEATREIVVFLDDDIRPESSLLPAHSRAMNTSGAALVAGRVIQPWQEGLDFSEDEAFHFASLQPGWITEFMGGNFAVRRDIALRLGGFDENFVRVAYNFEAEFAHRLIRAGHRIWFEPRACIHHLKAQAGGTRIYGNHLTTVTPSHAVGAYYFLLRTSSGFVCIRKALGRLIRSVVTRHHLKRPWWIPVTLAAELSGFVWALILEAKGPRYVKRSTEQKGTRNCLC